MAIRHFDDEAPLRPASDFAVDERVAVYGIGSWYDGTVIEVGRSRVSVRYVTGNGNTYTKKVNPSKASPVRLGYGTARRFGLAGAGVRKN